MLPTDPAKHDEYRQRLRDGRLRQGMPGGFPFSDERKANMSRGKRKYFSVNRPVGHIDKHGYRLIRVDGKSVPEHRHVMQGIVGRPLLPEETVHHKNGDRLDNRPENLELWSSRNPKGQRIEDKVKFAKEILALYGDADFLAHEDDFTS